MTQHLVNLRLVLFAFVVLAAGVPRAALAEKHSVPDACAAAGDHWKSAEAIGTIAAFEDHLARFPNCPFASLAAIRIENLKAISHRTWLGAVDPQNPHWTREPQLREMLGGIQIKESTRQKVHALLGPPGYTAEQYYTGHGFTGGIEKYRLSAKNNESFRVDFDSSGSAHGSVEWGACACPPCHDLFGKTDFVVESTAVSDLLGRLLPSRQKSFRAAELEGLLGHVGRRRVEEAERGGQIWVYYDLMWHIGVADEDRFLFVGGHVPKSKWSSFEDSPLDDFEVITLSTECRAP